MEIASAYSDGGCVGRNPSTLGGTWAYVLLSAAGEVLAEESGLVTPADVGLPAVTNNYTELLAAVRALEALPAGWQGTLYTDSFVTLCRITTGKKFAGIPEPLRERCLTARAGLRHRVVLLGGHPSRDDLFRGRRKDGLPVSKWNVRCDALCGEQARRFLAAQERKAVSP